MEEIKVNTNCKIDTKHFSISRKDNLNIAINITSLKALSLVYTYCRNKL